MPSLRALCVVALAGAASCGGGSNPVSPPPAPPPPPPVYTMTVLAGADQEAIPGTAVPTTPVFAIRDGQGNGAAGRTVNFEVSTGGGSIALGSAVTGADGTASPGKWTLGPDEGSNQLRASSGTLAATVNAQGRHQVQVLADATLGPQGGVVTYTKEGDPLSGLRLEVPAGAYTTSGQWTITYRSAATAPDLPAMAAPVVSVRTTQGRAAKMITLKVPIRRTTGDSIPTAFLFDPASNRLDPVPVLGFDATSVTIGALDFTPLALDPPAAAQLRRAGGPFRNAEGQEVRVAFAFVSMGMLEKSPNGVASEFDPLRDAWEFPNLGSYVTPAGGASGISLSAYFFWLQNHRQAISRNLFEFFSTIRGHWPDDPGYRLAALAELDIDWPGLVPALEMLNGPTTYGAFSRDQAMLILITSGIQSTREPQLLVATGPGAGVVLLVAYRVSMAGVSVMDPNDPGQTILIPFQGGAFQSFTLPALTGGPARTFTQVTPVGTNAVLVMPHLSGRFADLESAGTVSDSRFPAYTIQYYDGGAGIWKNVTGEVKAPRDELRIRVLCPTCDQALPVQGDVAVGQTAFDAYDGAGTLLGGDRGTGYLALQPPGGKSTINVHILGRCAQCGSGWLHIDYRAVKVDVTTVTISPNPLVLDAGAEGTLTAAIEGTPPPQLRYDWTFGDGTTEQVIDRNTVPKSYLNPGSYDVTVTVTDRENGQVVGQGSARALIGLTRAAWRVTSWKQVSLLVPIEGDTSVAMNEPANLEPFGFDFALSGGLANRPGLGVIFLNPVPVTIGSVTYPAGMIVQYGQSESEKDLNPARLYRVLAQQPDPGRAPPEEGSADRLDISGTLSNGGIEGTAALGIQTWGGTAPSRSVYWVDFESSLLGPSMTGRIQFQYWVYHSKLVVPDGCHSFACARPEVKFIMIARRVVEFTAERIP